MTATCSWELGQNRVCLVPLLNKHVREYENHPVSNPLQTLLWCEAEACVLQKASLFVTSFGAVLLLFISTHVYVWFRLFTFKLVQLQAREMSTKIQFSFTAYNKLMDIEITFANYQQQSAEATHGFPHECSSWKCWFWWMDAEANEWKHPLLHQWFWWWVCE